MGNVSVWYDEEGDYLELAQSTTKGSSSTWGTACSSGFPRTKRRLDSQC